MALFDVKLFFDELSLDHTHSRLATSESHRFRRRRRRSSRSELNDIRIDYIIHGSSSSSSSSMRGIYSTIHVWRHAQRCRGLVLILSQTQIVDDKPAVWCYIVVDVGFVFAIDNEQFSFNYVSLYIRYENFYLTINIAHYIIYTVFQKGATKLMAPLAVTSSNLNWFSKLFHRWKDKEISNKLTYYFQPHLKYAAALPLGIQKFKFVVKLPNKIKTRIIFVKNESFIHMAIPDIVIITTVAQIVCSLRCAKTPMPFVNCIVNGALVHSMLNVQQTLLLLFYGFFKCLNTYH